MSSKKGSTTEKKKKSTLDLETILEETINNIRADRNRISSVLDTFVSNEDQDKIIFTGDSIAKIADSLVKNNNLMVSIAGLIAKKQDVEETTPNSLFDEIGGPYKKPEEEDYD